MTLQLVSSVVRVAAVHPTATGDLAFFNFLSREESILLHVLFAHRDTSGRGAHGRIDAPHSFLPGRLLWRNQETAVNYVWNRGLSAALARLKPDVLLVGGYGNLAGIRSIRWAVRGGVPWVLSSDTRDYHDTLWLKRRLKRVLLPRLLSTAAGYVTFGESGERYLRSMGIGGQGVTIGSNRDLVRIARAADALRSVASLDESKGAFIYVGRLVELKGVDLLLDAFSRVCESMPGWRLLIAGDGPLRERVVASAREGVPIDWLGAVPFERLPEVLARADVLVVPSRRDAWGLVVSEAMAAGLPVIASEAVGSASHFVRAGETGWMFATGDRLELARSMLQATRRDLSAMRRRARDLALKSDVRKGSAAVAALLRKIAWQRPSGVMCRASPIARNRSFRCLT